MILYHRTWSKWAAKILDEGFQDGDAGFVWLNDTKSFAARRLRQGMAAMSSWYWKFPMTWWRRSPSRPKPGVVGGAPRSPQNWLNM